MSLPKTPSFSLEGKSALVVGATSGIGLACAAAVAEAGADVTMAARSTDKLNELTEEFASRGWMASAMTLDVSEVEDIEPALDKVAAFDIMINSAGLARHGPALETSVADFDAVMGVNLRGAYFLTQCCAKKLFDNNKTGSLINISSQMAKVGGQDRSVYCASKFALEGFTKAMAIEWGPMGIRVNTICPTFIKTPLAEQTFSDPVKRAWVEDKIKLGRIGEVEDIMGAAVYLASGASSMVTGTALMVDGGWTAD